MLYDLYNINVKKKHLMMDNALKDELRGLQSYHYKYITKGV